MKNFVFNICMLLLVSLCLNTVIDVTESVSAPEDYLFDSVISAGSPLSSFFADSASINNNGTVLYSIPDTGEFNLFKYDGVSSSFFMTLFATNLMMNDAEQIAAQGFASGFNLIRINPDTSIQTLATIGADEDDDFLGLSNSVLAINDFGDVAATVQNKNSSFSIELFSDSIPIQRTIVLADANIFNLTAPALNDQTPTVTAFKAQQSGPGFPAVNIYTGTGGPLTNEGPNPTGGNSGVGASINNSGLTISTNSIVIYKAQGGITTELTGADYQVGSLGFVSINDSNQYVFQGADASTGDKGIFIGPDPVQNRVIKEGDTLFGGVVTDLRFVQGAGFLNNNGQVLFEVETDTDGTIESHLVIATPNGIAPVLNLFSPSQAGVENTLTVNGATPNGDVTFIWGFTEQTVTADNICTGLQAGILNPRILTTLTADGAGYVSLNVNVPANFAGISLVIQAVDITTCTGSNVNPETIADSPAPNPPVLDPMDPGTAGGLNTLTAAGATPNRDVTFIWGFTEQTVPADNICAGLQAGIFNPRILTTVTADGSGITTFNVNVPANFAGIAVVIQAVDITTCLGSNINEETL